MADDPITRHFFNGFIRVHILYHAAKEPIYGAEITEELVRHGYRISQGTLYPTLHLLEELALPGPIRPGQAAEVLPGQPAGRKVLADARAKLLELVAEVIEGQDQPFRAIQQKRRRRQGDQGPRT